MPDVAAGYLPRPGPDAPWRTNIYRVPVVGGAETAEQRRALQHALLELTPDQREVFVLKHVEGLSYGEIAERLSTSIPSLKMRMHRAYDKLRERLRDHT